MELDIHCPAKAGRDRDRDIKLGELLQEKQLSKNKFAQRAEMERTQLNRYINNDVALLSVDVLARMCDVLECRIEDILEYREK